MSRLFAVVLVGLVLPAAASAQEHALAGLRDLHRACRSAEVDGPRELYSVVLANGQWAFDRFEPDLELLPLNTRRNLRAFRGAAELFPSRMETVGFVADPDRARELREAKQSGARLRVGFFLGFDGTGGTLCLIRSVVGVTTVRMDIAYIELLDERRRVIAREDTDRYRAWLDDREREAIPGSGPRGAAGPARSSVAIPDRWQQAIVRANAAQLGRALSRCHAGAAARGGHARGQVVVRMSVDPRTGATSDAEVELTTVGDDAEAHCVCVAVSRLTLPPAPSLFAQRVTVRIPVRLVR